LRGFKLQEKQRRKVREMERRERNLFLKLSQSKKSTRKVLLQQRQLQQYQFQQRKFQETNLEESRPLQRRMLEKLSPRSLFREKGGNSNQK
jgi:hypothetical protein